MITYKDSGVDIKKGEALVEKIKTMVTSTYGERVVQGVGGFACLYRTGDRLLAAGTDGVGTKLKLAQQLNKHDTIGIDLVAMCVNDILCTGARPLFFMDYLATGKLDVEVSEQIIRGVVEGCKQSGAALIGGETAEMPGMYTNGEYDLAGFSVGEVFEKDLIDGNKIEEGDTLIGLASTGAHSNGFSLIRKLLNSDEEELMELALEPTRIYWKTIETLMQKLPGVIKGMAHITGGGWTNIARMNDNFDYHISKMPEYDEISPLFSVLKKRSKMGPEELYETFNMGVGFVIATSKPAQVREILEECGEKHWTLGRTQKGEGKVILGDLIL
jgi:phosphoribosylformylglycinamidine cyclo-ligase